MSNIGSIEGSIFNSNKIFMFSDSYTSLKKCMKNKKNEGHSNIVIDLMDYEGEFYHTAFEIIKKVSTEVNIGVSVTGVPKSDISPYSPFYHWLS